MDFEREAKDERRRQNILVMEHGSHNENNTCLMFLFPSLSDLVSFPLVYFSWVFPTHAGCVFTTHFCWNYTQSTALREWKKRRLIRRRRQFRKINIYTPPQYENVAARGWNVLLFLRKAKSSRTFNELFQLQPRQKLALTRQSFLCYYL